MSLQRELSAGRRDQHTEKSRHLQINIEQDVRGKGVGAVSSIIIRALRSAGDGACQRGTYDEPFGRTWTLRS